MNLSHFTLDVEELMSMCLNSSENRKHVEIQAEISSEPVPSINFDMRMTFTRIETHLH